MYDDHLHKLHLAKRTTRRTGTFTILAAPSLAPSLAPAIWQRIAREGEGESPRWRFPNYGLFTRDKSGGSAAESNRKEGGRTGRGRKQDGSDIKNRSESNQASIQPACHATIPPSRPRPRLFERMDPIILYAMLAHSTAAFPYVVPSLSHVPLKSSS